MRTRERESRGKADLSRNERRIERKNAAGVREHGRDDPTRRRPSLVARRREKDEASARGCNNSETVTVNTLGAH